MPMQCMTHERFLDEYELELDQEFEYNGTSASWAEGQDGPRLWGTEDAAIALSQSDPEKGNTTSAAIALTPDEKYVAVATNAVIRIYDVQSQYQYAELVGHIANVQEVFFAPQVGANASMTNIDSAGQARHAKYLLMSEGAEVGGGDGNILAGYLDENGRPLVVPARPLDVQGLAEKAFAAILPALESDHGLKEAELKPIREDFKGVLKTAAVQQSAKGIPAWEGQLPSFGTFPISHDGESFFYTDCGETTQHGMRSDDELPQLVIVNLATEKERHRLKGHTDAIMWAGWSADDKIIATASWDEHFRIWDAQTGECKHTIGPTDGQNWRGHFSPDGKHVLLSGGQPVKVAIYNCDTGAEIAKLERPGIKLASWVRYLSWNPNGNDIAISNDNSVILWNPFDGEAETILKFSTDDTLLRRFNDISIIKWVDGGRKLVLQDSEATTFVWDRETNRKWRFQRPQGTTLRGDRDVVFAGKTQTVLTLDGDGKVRYWKV